jgi:hypothetical protein
MIRANATDATAIQKPTQRPPRFAYRFEMGPKPECRELGNCRKSALLDVNISRLCADSFFDEIQIQVQSGMSLSF